MAEQATEKDTEQPKGRSPSQWQKYWHEQVDAAQKRLRKFRRQGDTVVSIFLDERAAQNDPTDTRGNPVTKLNLFHTNVVTLQSMLYGQTPRVDVSREHNDPEDDVARVASNIIQRILQADVEPSGEDCPTVLKACLQDRLLPGLGIARVRYDFDTTTIPMINPQSMQVEEAEIVTYEDAPINYVHWKDFLWGWCRTWAEMPWMGFRAYLDKDQATERFGSKIARSLEYKNQQPSGDDNKEHSEDKDQQNVTQKAEIWEIWNMDDRRVYWYAEGQDNILDAQDDPLGLDGFWPTPKPLMANQTTKLFVPKADYTFAQDLYTQINELATRITIITQAIKVVGVYDQSAGDSVGRMLSEGVENDIIPVDNWAMFAEKGGLKGVIDWFPVEEVVGVLTTLRQVLGETIELLYQVTGMSDILRGANTDQYTSDGTNQLKAKFGSIRVQALQDEFARFASDLEALKAEVVAKHFQEESITKQAGVRWLPSADHNYIPDALRLIKSPDVKWRINIRPESIAMVDYAQLKQERTEFLNAMATYIQSAQAMMKETPEALPILMEMLKWGMAGFKGSDYLEGIMDQAIQQAIKAQQQSQGNQEPSPEQIKLQTEQLKGQQQQQKIAGEIRKIQVKAQADMQALQQKVAGEIQKIQMDARADQSLEQMQAQNRLIEIARELESNIAEIRANMQADLTIEEAQARFDIASQQQDHENNMREIGANAAVATMQQNQQTDTD